MKLVDLLYSWAISDVPDSDISGIQNDSRRVMPGYLFLAYPGARFDGRLFIQKSCDAGAVAVAYDPKNLPPNLHFPKNIPCIPVPNLAEKLAAIASRFYHNPTQSLSITGVTGTNGKTTIAYLLAQAYGLLGKKAAYMGTLGQGDVHTLEPLMNTTPDALALQQFFYDYQQKGIEQVCMEVSSHALCQGRVDHIDFVGAIYTNLSHEHLDYHHTMDAYARAKAKLFALSSLKWAVINHDDAYGQLMVKQLPPGCIKYTYGLNKGGDVTATNYQIGMSGSEFKVISPWGQHSVRVNLLGQFNIYNSLAVFTSLLAQGFDARDVTEVMAKLQASPGRMEVVSKNPCVIVDYAHTPDALENVLLTLQRLKQGRLGVVFGCGGDRDKTKRPMMGGIASKYADFIIITSDNPRTEAPSQIIDDVAEGLLPGVRALRTEDREEAIGQGLTMMGLHDILLIAGKGHEAYQEIGGERFPFSDQDVVRRLIKDRF
jgi:UDP-N-acetylmuramoyl-L-alanyl-D-glutamate--2,6-diaminopimelate ligase